MRGGKPGFYPSLKEASAQGFVPHPVPFDLFNPFGLLPEQTPEQKERGRNVEINNGRAAMLGIFGFISASKGLIVPGLDAIPGVGRCMRSGRARTRDPHARDLPPPKSARDGAAHTPHAPHSAVDRRRRLHGRLPGPRRPGPPLCRVDDQGRREPRRGPQLQRGRLSRAHAAASAAAGPARPSCENAVQPHEARRRQARAWVADRCTAAAPRRGRRGLRVSVAGAPARPRVARSSGPTLFVV